MDLLTLIRVLWIFVCVAAGVVLPRLENAAHGGGGWWRVGHEDGDASLQWRECLSI